MLRTLVFNGDFIVHHREWLNSVSPADGHGLRALDFSSECGCEQIIRKPTQRSNCLELLFTDSPGVVAASVGTPVGTSDHFAICVTIKTEHAVLDVSFSRKIFIVSRADWHGISTDLSNVDWPHIYHLPDFVSALSDCIAIMIKRHIPSRNLKLYKR